MIENIVIDAGHGGLDSNGMYTTAPKKMFKFPDGEVAYEGVLNRQIAKQLYSYLKTHNEFNLIYTVDPNNATDISLRDRVRIANKFDKLKTIFISIHCNAGGGTGFEIFTSKGPTLSDILAEKIATKVEPLYSDVKLKLRYDFSDGDRDKEADFYVLRKTNSPAVLLECGFFDNKKDFNLLKTENFQLDLAYKIYLGILEFINQ